MRQPKRIPIVLANISWFNFLRKISNYNEMDAELKRLCDKVNENKTKIEEYWKQNPDLRLTQVLVNLELIPNFPGGWYYIEEVDWLIEQQILEPRDIKFWGVNYTKDMTPLEETDWRLIKDLETDHIEAILEGRGRKNGNAPWCGPSYLPYFQNELKLRKNESKNSEVK